ncbi:MAG: hypothetical protein KDB80_01655 [Planctomycetes bacterium]|nr:hypothetical protein [Planctomycetota bacterium]
MGDTILTILAPDGTILASNDDDPTNPGSLFSLVTVDLDPGTYYAQVRPFSNPVLGTDHGDYALDIVLCEQTDLQLAPPEVEPNNHCTAAMPTHCNRLHEYALQYAGDTDFFEIAVASTRAIVFETLATSTVPQLDTRIWLYDSVCRELDNDDDGGEGFLSRLEATLSPGAYYVEVSDWRRSRSGTYRFAVNCLDPVMGSGTSALTSFALPPTDLCGSMVTAPPEFEPNDACVTATPAQCCSEHFSTLQGPSDVDFYRLVLANERIVTFETQSDTSTTGIPLTDSKIRLFDSNCQQLATDDDSGPGLMSRLTRTLGPGLYYVSVADHYLNGTGDYRLTIGCLVDDPGCSGSSGPGIEIAPRQGERAVRGTLCSTDLRNTPPGTVMLIGTQAGPIVELGLVGAPTCHLAVTPIVTLPVVMTGLGEGEFTLPLVLSPDVTLYLQAAAIDIGANALGVILSQQRLEWAAGDQPL